MLELKDVQEYAQQIAEAIAAVLKIDVEIADKNLIRVAGTGIHSHKVGRSMNRQGYIYREVIRHGHELVIDNPGKHELCQPCEQWGNCLEKCEIAYPINLDDQAVGAIGLLAFTEESARLVMENRNSYLTFLGKMAETVALKLKESEFLDGLVLSNRYLNSIMDCLKEGLLTVDLNGKISHYNQVAASLFPGNISLPGATLDLLLGHRLAGEILTVAKNGKEILEREVSVGNKESRLQLVLRARPIVAAMGEGSIIITLDRITEISRIVNRFSAHEANYTVDDILGASDTIVQLRERAKIIASSNSTVLIRGESGTGKEMLARAIHSLSPRRQAPFIAINCTAIPEALLESELFGYEDGAFTGARRGGKLGKVELANRGTLFLDEIGDMPIFLQAKILRMLQERQIERVGGLQPIPVDVRVIVATHRNLEQMISQGEFRQDLYYRINVIPMLIEPLRDRKEDLDILCEHFIGVYNQQLNKNIQILSPGFHRKLEEYDWPGSVRELQNTIEYAMNLAPGDTLDVEHLPARIRDAGGNSQAGSSYNLETIEREAILRCLQKFGTTLKGKEKAADALGIGIATLYRKLVRYGINTAQNSPTLR
jgi:transcriptional regulator with PAS, ATPase and Fis domain